MIHNQYAGVFGPSSRRLRWKLFAVLLITASYLTSAAAASAQVAFSPNAAQSASQNSEDDRTTSATSLLDSPTSSRYDRATTTSSADLMGSSAPLPADRIIQILQQNPDLVMQLKTMLADRMQQNGTQLAPTDISDEMLYDQISTNAAVRTNVSTFLRVRGYVSQGDPSSLSPSGLPGSADSDLALAARSSSMLNDITGALNLTAGSDDPNSEPNARADRPSDSSGSKLYPELSQRQEAKRTPEEVNTSTDAPKVHRQDPPYNLQSMRDLYAQIPEQSRPLKRFGSEVFLDRTNMSVQRGTIGRDTPMDVPVGPDYIVGPGDALAINIWGGVALSLTRVVDREGRILLPEAGSLDVAGLPLQKAEAMMEGALKRQYRNAQVSVSVSRLRSVRVYVVGDVQRPGAYDVSALATPLAALYAAGGPTAVGSLRSARHYRGQQLVEEVDLYDFLLHGIRNGSARFESGDTLLVPPAGPQVAVSGSVKRPAIYELKQGGSTLASVIDDAGGVSVAASLGNITIERIDANHQRETVTVKVADAQAEHGREALEKFQVKDGDRIRIAPILPYSERAIYLQGHVVRPGRVSYTDGMKLSDVLHGYRDLLPEPGTHGEIIRLLPPDLHAETIEFNVPDVLIGNANLTLQPFDTIRIFGRYQLDTPNVTIRGEVLHPGMYPMSDGMTAAQLVRIAGGFKRDALLDSADLTSYGVVNGNRVLASLSNVHIGTALAGTDSKADVSLKPGDILTIHQITGWNEIGQSITIQGQIRFPGSYGFTEGERLSSVLRRAGGLRDSAYAEGAVLVRTQVRQLEEKSRQELIRQIESTSAAARVSPTVAGNGGGNALQLIKMQQDQVLAELKNHPSAGRMVIHISADIDTWANTPADIEVRSGDVLTIPKRPGFVLVTGQVYNATALTYAPGRTAGWYLSHAGGTNTAANRKEVFIIHANGSVVGRRSGGLFGGDVLSTRLSPGDVVVVPQKIIGASLLWRNLLSTAQLASSVAITGAVALSGL
jgi:protein involved in polysaccharide export with SLBB domain